MVKSAIERNSLLYELKSLIMSLLLVILGHVLNESRRITHSAWIFQNSECLPHLSIGGVSKSHRRSGAEELMIPDYADHVWLIGSMPGQTSATASEETVYCTTNRP
jgi:hypothetical protein